MCWVWQGNPLALTAPTSPPTLPPSKLHALLPPPLLPLQLPFYTSWFNCFKACFMMVHAWIAVLLVFLTWTVSAQVEEPASESWTAHNTHNPGTTWVIAPEDESRAKLITNVRGGRADGRVQAVY